MGEVYRARDSKLNRDVALKVLPDSFANDPERLARFQREAQVLASLNHPNIGGIYGLEETNGVGALVLELVEGPTLADRIAQGPIPLDEALPIAQQIAEALEAAHERGVIHRDLKPANIKVRPDGAVKVLDFGLAKALDPASSTAAASASNSPTITTPAATRVGVILGTAAYMSPEQAKGKPVDKRCDIWAFGCVLYEMLTGKRTFGGDDVTDTIAAVVRAEPDWSALPANTPAPIRKLLRGCLQKDRRDRVPDIAVARIDLKEALTTSSLDGDTVTATVAAPGSRRRERLAWMAFAVLAAAGSIALAVPYFRTPVGAPEMRLEITTPATSDPISFAISPDGRRLVFVASGDGPSRLWLRPLDTPTAQPLAGTEGGSYPFWSPDSRSVGFFVNGSLKRVDIGGGLPQTLASNSASRGGTWSPEGVILFASTATARLFRVPATGGEAVAVTKLVSGQTSHRFPQILPGGRQFLFYVTGMEESAGIYLGSLDAPDVKRLTGSDTPGAYSPPGWLFFARQGTLVARRFDLTRWELNGDPVTVADSVAIDSAVFLGAFSVSPTGLVTYRTGGAARKQLTWFDRSGKLLGTLGAPDDTQVDLSLSPDGHRVAVSRVAQRNTDIWLIDAARTTRFTFDPGSDRYPQWSPDGSRIVFSRNRNGVFDLYQKPSSGAGAEELLLESPQHKAAVSWSLDGASVLYVTVFPKTNYDLWVLPMAGDRRPFPFLNSNFAESAGAHSADGRWVAYASNESGRPEVYVRPFPGPGGQWQVSTSGGVLPRWRPDGKELYYVAPDGKLMVVPITVKGAEFEPGLPAALFQTRIVYSLSLGYGWQYDVTSDGRFLINVTTGEATASPITLILNWAPGLKK